MDFTSLRLFVRNSIEIGKPYGDVKDIASQLASKFHIESAANIKHHSATDIDTEVVDLHTKGLLKPAITNFLDKLFRFSQDQGDLSGESIDSDIVVTEITAEQQNSVDTVVKDLLARHLATAFSSFTELSDFDSRNRVIETIKKNNLTDRIANYYKNGLKEYVFEDGIPRVINQHEVVDTSKIFSPLVPWPNEIRIGNHSHSFGLADMVLLMELGLIEEKIEYKAACLDSDENLLSTLVMRRLNRCVLSNSSTNTFFGFDSETHHIPVISYLSNEDKAKDLLRVLNSIDFTDCNSKTNIFTKLVEISYEIVYNDESNEAMNELMQKIVSLLKTYGTQNHYGETENKFQSPIDLINGSSKAS